MRLSSFIFTLGIGMALWLPLSTKAHSPTLFQGGGYWGGAPDQILSCTGSRVTINEKVAVPNVTNGCNLCQLLHTGRHIIYFALTILIYVIVPALFLWGGALIMLSAGSTEKVSQGKSIVKGTLVGVSIALVAFLIVDNLFTFLAPTVDITDENGQKRTIKVDWKNIQCNEIPDAFILE